MDYQSGAVRPIGSFQEGWNIIKNDYWTYVLMVLVLGVIFIAASFILGLITNIIVSVVSAAFGAAMPKNPSEVTQASSLIVPQLIAQTIGIFTNIIVTTLAA